VQLEVDLVEAIGIIGLTIVLASNVVSKAL
jgi:hypothetical protein